MCMLCNRCGWDYDKDEFKNLNGNILCEGCFETEAEYIKDEYGYEPEDRKDFCLDCHKTLPNCQCD